MTIHTKVLNPDCFLLSQLKYSGEWFPRFDQHNNQQDF